MVVKEVFLEHLESLKEFYNGRNELYMIIEHITGKEKSFLIFHDDYNLTENQEAYIKACVDRRILGEPLQYIINEQYFFGRKFYVDENVLIPRADTEVLVEEVIKVAKDIKSPKILDLCTGSGCIAITLKKELPSAKVYATDISERALNVARKNAENLNADVSFMQSDLFDNICECNFDIIVSNPPYIETDVCEKLDEQVKKEPLLALDGGEDGLKFYREIVFRAKEFLKAKKYIFFEIGYNQGEKVREILEKENYKDIEVIKDFSGNDRVVKAS